MILTRILLTISHIFMRLDQNYMMCKISCLSTDYSTHQKCNLKKEKLIRIINYIETVTDEWASASSVQKKHSLLCHLLCLKHWELRPEPDDLAAFGQTIVPSGRKALTRSHCK